MYQMPSCEVDPRCIRMKQPNEVRVVRLPVLDRAASSIRARPGGSTPATSQATLPDRLRSSMELSPQRLHLIDAGSHVPGPGTLPLTFSPSRLPPLANPPDDAGQAPLVEPFRNQHGQLRLFALFGSGHYPVVNGEPAPRVVVLKPGDHFSWGPGHPGFQVALYTRPALGPPPFSVLGKPCPVCRVPFQESSVCFHCSCGVAMHCEPDGAESLQCAVLRGSCPVCRRPVLKEGYDESTLVSSE